MIYEIVSQNASLHERDVLTSYRIARGSYVPLCTAFHRSISENKPVLFGTTFAPVHLSSSSSFLPGEKRKKDGPTAKVQLERTGLIYMLFFASCRLETILYS